MLGDHYRFRKSAPYEGSVNIPLIIRDPGSPPGQVSQHPACLEDVMPTLLTRAGLGVPDSVDGEDLGPCLRGEDPGRRTLHLCYADQWQAETDGVTKHIRFADGREQRFDLHDDPRECRNLIDSA